MNRWIRGPENPTNLTDPSNFLDSKFEIATLVYAKDFPNCSIPDDRIDPRRWALFVARSILTEMRDGRPTC